MPYKDPERRRAAAGKYSLAHYYRTKAKKAEGSCSTCLGLRDDPRFKKCSKCRAYMRAYKKPYRSKPKPAGICSVADCRNEAIEGRRLCRRCLDRLLTEQKQYRPKIRARARATKSEVFAAYGGRCLCCGESDEAFLTIDHVDGYVAGPRAGLRLYRWLRRNKYPVGFRVLCATCNYTLGHHGYCPHSNLTQRKLCGRPRIHKARPDEAEWQAKRRQYMIEAYKLPALDAYGGRQCVCCGEPHVECLTIDHIAGDGAEHRRQDLGTRNLYIWLKRHRYPPGFQVLCMNCNLAKGQLGQCPHQASASRRPSGKLPSPTPGQPQA